MPVNLLDTSPFTAKNLTYAQYALQILPLIGNDVGIGFQRAGAELTPTLTVPGGQSLCVGPYLC